MAEIIIEMGVPWKRMPDGSLESTTPSEDAARILELEDDVKFLAKAWRNAEGHFPEGVADRADTIADKYVPSTIIVGEYGEPVITRGYSEIAGVRIYDDE